MNESDKMLWSLKDHIQHEPWCLHNNLPEGKLAEVSYVIEQNGNLARMRCGHCHAVSETISKDELTQFPPQPFES